MYFADRASDDGAGIWASKVNIAADIEMSRQGVQKIIKEFVGAGIITEVGKRKIQNGFTFEYALNLDAINALESTRKSSQDANSVGMSNEPHANSVGMTCKLSWHQDANSVGINHPRTTHEPSLIVNSAYPAVDAYNEIASRLDGAWPKAVAGLDGREKAAMKRAKECGGFENWVAAIERASQSSFLSGRKTGTTPGSLDWFNKTANFIKLMEGNYDDKSNGKPSGQDKCRQSQDAFIAGAISAAGTF